MASAVPRLVLDTDLVIVEMNAAYLLATRRRREDILGKNLFEALPPPPNACAVESTRNLRASLEHVLRHGTVHRLAEQKYDLPAAEPGAGTVEERYWTAVNTPVFDAHGRLTHILQEVEDITGQFRYERALRESETRFRALTNATADVVYRMSPDWKYMHELDGRGFVKDTAALGAYHIEDYVHPDDLDLARRAIEDAIRDKTMLKLEHRVLRAGGGHGWTYSKAVPILDARGEIREWIGSASDISARKAAEEELAVASRRKDEFLAMLAHELRNPLAPIRAAAQLIQLRALDQDKLRHASQIVERQVAHMTHLVDELLDVSRVARGLTRLERDALDIRHVVKDAVEQVMPLVQARRHRLDLRLPSAPALVAGDEKRLVQIVANLLNNAAKFTPQGGMLQLKTDVLPAQVRIEVIDDGIGMTEETARHAFELFSQAERSADRAAGGLGLGLALVKNLVELHGGTVGGHSPGPGAGSRFTVCLPRLAAEAASGAPRATPAAPDGGGGSLAILVVDDNEDAAGMLALLLESMGHRVAVEHGARRALERAQDLAPQVCVLDIGLPDMDGHALARRLRAEPGTADALLIALSGYGQESDRSQSLAAGFDHHLVKPVDLAQLAAALLTPPASAGRA